MRAFWNPACNPNELNLVEILAETGISTLFLGVFLCELITMLERRFLFSSPDSVWER